MQLRSPPRGTSFYESFSDLIFATLIVFLVVVMALVVRVNGKQDEFDEAAKSRVQMHQYTGGSSTTRWGIGLFVRGDDPYVVLLPRDVWADVNVNRGDLNDPIMDLCEAATSPRRGLAILSWDEFRRMDDAFNFPLLDRSLRVPTYYGGLDRAVQLIDAAMLRGTRTAPEIYRAIGGMHADRADRSEPDRRLLPALQAQQRFLYEGNPRDDAYAWIWRYDQLLQPLQDAVADTRDEPPTLRFSAEPDGRIRLGRLIVTTQQMRAILRTFSTGRGFRLEYVAGSEPEDPPRWVIDEVLAPTGFDKRVLSNEAIDALRRDREP